MAATNSLSLSSTPVTIKLDSTNYLLWKMQIEPTLAGQDLFKHVDGSAPAPAVTIDSLSPFVIHMLVGIKTIAQAWKTLAKAFSTGSPAQIRSLKTQLLDLRLNTDTISAYLQKAKLVSDQLQALGQPITDADLVQYVLRGLPSAYRPLICTIHNRSDTIGFLELHGLVVSEELDLAMDDVAAMLAPQANYVQTPHYGRGHDRRGRGRGYYNPGRGQSPSRGNYQST
ncbi:Retrovirus-related Pol polyprotein from transposon RE1 [Linum grandiflorum]